MFLALRPSPRYPCRRRIRQLRDGSNGFLYKVSAGLSSQEGPGRMIHCQMLLTLKIASSVIIDHEYIQCLIQSKSLKIFLKFIPESPKIAATASFENSSANLIFHLRVGWGPTRRGVHSPCSAHREILTLRNPDGTTYLTNP